MLLTSNYKKIPELFDSLYLAAVPAKFTFRYLQSLGFKSSNMRDLIPFLIEFGFLDENGHITSSYKELKQSPNPANFVSVCAKKHYADISPLISTLDASFLEEIFSKHYSSNAQYQSSKNNLYVQTFLALQKYANFVDISQNVPKADIPQKFNTFTQKYVSDEGSTKVINININLPVTQNEKIYEIIFKNLKEILN